MSILPNPTTYYYNYPPALDRTALIRDILNSELDEATKLKVIGIITKESAPAPVTAPVYPTPRGGQVYPYTQPWTTTINVDTAGMRKVDEYQNVLFDFDATGKLVDGVQVR